jgi:hypothetical protein
MDMNRIRLSWLVAMMGACSVAAAAEPTADRDQRMNEALQNYRSAADRNPSPGPVARAEESTKRGVKNAGAAIKRGAKKAGHAVGTGVEKTGAAIHRGGEKIKESTSPAK